MKTAKISNLPVALLILSTIMLAASTKVFAHCDTMDGPVVKAAQKALETGNVNLVLIWVPKQDETELKKAFQKTLTVRELNAEAKELADMYFFETLVRLHRASEGAPYTGIKPAGTDIGPAIPVADKAIKTGSAEPILKLLNDTIHEGIHERFKEVLEKKNYKENDIEAGREYVKAYVIFLHYVEPIYEAAKKQTVAHHQKTEKSETIGKEHHH